MALFYMRRLVRCTLTPALAHTSSFTECKEKYGIPLRPEGILVIQHALGLDTEPVDTLDAGETLAPSSLTSLSAADVVSFIAENGISARICDPQLPKSVIPTSPEVFAPSEVHPCAFFGPVCLQVVAPAARDVCAPLHPQPSTAAPTSSASAGDGTTPDSTGATLCIKPTPSTAAASGASAGSLTQMWLSDGHTSVEAVWWPDPGASGAGAATSAASGGIPPWLRHLLPGSLITFSRVRARAGVYFLSPAAVSAVDGLPVATTPPQELLNNAFSRNRRATRAALAEADALVRLTRRSPPAPMRTTRPSLALIHIHCRLSQPP
jgi:hypothetical protein